VEGSGLNLGQVQVVGSCGHGNEHSGSIKREGEVLGYLSDYMHLKIDCASWS
jgi:hypothetical protein